jgi:hypothetical protein
MITSIVTHLQKLTWNQVAGFPPRRPAFEPISCHVGFVVDKVVLVQIFPEYFGFPCQLSFYRLLHTHHLSSGAGTIGQLVTDVPSGLSLTPHKKVTTWNQVKLWRNALQCGRISCEDCSWRACIIQDKFSHRNKCKVRGGFLVFGISLFQTFRKKWDCINIFHIALFEIRVVQIHTICDRTVLHRARSVTADNTIIYGRWLQLSVHNFEEICSVWAEYAYMSAVQISTWYLVASIPRIESSFNTKNTFICLLITNRHQSCAFTSCHW